MARQIGGNLSTQRVLLGSRDVGISSTVNNEIVDYYDRLLDDELNADSVSFFCHISANHTTTVSSSGNKLAVAKVYMYVGQLRGQLKQSCLLVHRFTHACIM